MDKHMANENESKKEAPKLFVEGFVKACLVRNEMGITSNSNPQIELRFKVLEGADAGRFISWYAISSPNVSEKQREFRRKAMITAGWDGTKEGLKKKFPETEVTLKIKTTPASGEYPAKSEIEYINSVDGGRQSEPLTAEQTVKVADAMFDMFGAAPSPKTAKPAEKAAEDAFSKKDSSEIPF